MRDTGAPFPDHERARHPEATATGLGFGGLLCVATLLFYLISLTPFVDLTAAASTDPNAAKSNALNQIVFLGLTGATWFYALTSPMRADVAQPRTLLAVTMVWFCLVSVVSSYPDMAVKRVVLAFLTCVNASIFLLLPRSERQFASIIAFCALATLGIAYYGVIFKPDVAIHQAAEIREPMNVGLWRGHFPHKNAASVVMVLLSFFGLYVFRSGQRLIGLTIFVLAAFFLTKAGGKTATAALPLILVASWVFVRWPLLRTPMLCAGLVGINTITLGTAGFEEMRELVAALGVDPTFTNRTDIWRIGLRAVGDQPITGYGFQLFWQTDEMVYKASTAESWAFAAFNGHNGFLDMAVTTGLLGLVLTLVWVVVLPLHYVARISHERIGSPLTMLYVNIWIYGLFTGCFESILFSSGSVIWFAMLFAVFGLRLQAEAGLVSDPARPSKGLGMLGSLSAELGRWGRERRERNAAGSAAGPGR